MSTLPPRFLDEIKRNAAVRLLQWSFSMQPRRSLLLLLMTLGTLWMGDSSAGASVELAMSKDQPLCEKVLELFARAVGWDGRLQYEAGPFREIAWAPVELGGVPPKVRHCSTVEKAVFDLDNNGDQDLVVRTTFCMKGPPSDSLYVFPAESKVLEQTTWQNFAPLLSTKDKFERTGGTYPLAGPQSLHTVFTVRPFLLDGKAYVSLTDSRAEWIVVATYQKGGRFEDLCHLRTK